MASDSGRSGTLRSEIFLFPADMFHEMVVLSPSSAGGAFVAPGPDSVRAAARSRVQPTKEELAQIRELAAIDRTVRSHEQAHLAAAGPHAKGGASYTFATGPDGQLYAVAGEVALDVSADPSDPEKTIEKARVIQAAANAPADPSSQDRAVAAMAAQMEATARQELATRQRDLVAAAYAQPQTDAPGALFSLFF